MISIAVTETSQVAQARRWAAAVAQRAGFGEEDAGRVSIVATEIATNLVKHGSGGEMLAGIYEDPTGHGIELIGLDKGPGIHNVQACIEDGYSTAGSSGNGLGAIFRQSHFADIASWPGLGTAVLARLEPGRPPALQRAPFPLWGVINLPKPGEEVSGDSWCIDTASARQHTLMVVDGLGHGPEAAEASVEAVRIFQRGKEHPVRNILENIHLGLRSTRGAAVSVARIDLDHETVLFGGIGNVTGVIVAGGQTRRMLSHNGTAGHNARKIQDLSYPFANGLVILHSDGLGTSWSMDRYPGLAAAHPTLVAAVLYRDFNRGRDDVTVLVATGAAR
jgi:anti-sigma regulatory factor (Ser/Thr protein kinase)